MALRSNKLVELDLESIALNPLNVRLESSLQTVDALAKSIRTQGLIHPILVRPCAANQGFEIVCGERRFRAYQQLAAENDEYSVIPARVVDVDDAEALALMHKENSERTDWSQYEKALFYQSAYQSGAFSSLRVTASSLGLGTTTLHRYLKVFELPQPIIDKFASGEYGLAQMEVFVEAPPKLYKQLAAGFAQGWTKNDARHFISHGVPASTAQRLEAHTIKHKVAKGKVTLTLDADSLEDAITQLRRAIR